MNRNKRANIVIFISSIVLIVAVLAAGSVGIIVVDDVLYGWEGAFALLGCVVTVFGGVAAFATILAYVALWVMDGATS